MEAPVVWKVSGTMRGKYSKTRTLETDDSWSLTRGARRPGRAAGRGGDWGRPAGSSRGRRVVAQSRLRGAGGVPGLF